MITIEKIDELRARVNVTYEEAKEALENTNGDILEAIIYIEKKNKSLSIVEKKQEESGEAKVSEGFACFIKWCKSVIKKGNRNKFVIKKKEQTVLKFPITLMVLAVFFAPYIVVPLLIIALFTGHQFLFSGEDVEKTKANVVMDKASQFAEDIKVELQK
ncbi:DUF4342 domain-containing protein [Clostridium cellulovorans]|uniref:Ubiquitin-associated-domain-containing protein n=1 Tax=Clostridium cellulovorans (strain ATCC 35296 / DSM 3052 / OCM 3 / 743B) TaxID=573061 RepID=D9SVE3_CLOC7|nr:DUF4342 domain-containing protein [Clostridium cellulovorans]ADL51067.1 ubiquitin-associated- domain-containing protein [Clostridium cellulovorans 743B]